MDALCLPRNVVAMPIKKLLDLIETPNNSAHIGKVLTQSLAIVIKAPIDGLVTSLESIKTCGIAIVSIDDHVSFSEPRLQQAKQLTVQFDNFAAAIKTIKDILER